MDCICDIKQTNIVDVVKVSVWRHLLRINGRSIRGNRNSCLINVKKKVKRGCFLGNGCL